jgi:FPC/CPF motif-containing protein YcgG
MSFNKRYLSEKSIKIRANDDYVSFYKYFHNPDALIIEDEFSSNIFDKIRVLKVTDKDRIIEIMNECKE